MKKRRILAALLSAAMVLSLAGCTKGGDDGASSSAGAGNSTSNKLTIWAWDDTFNVKAANIAKEYYAKINPDVQVNVVSMSQDDIVVKLNTAFESGNTSGLPNIVLIEDYRIQNYLQSYPDQLSDLSDVVDSSKFMDYKLKTMTKDGKIYGVPFDSGVACVFYRTDLIEQAGYKKEDMQDLTWQEFIEIGKKVKEKTGKAMLSLDPNDLGLIRMMMQSAGKWYVDEDGKADIKDNAALKEALTIYKQMQDAGITTTASGWDAGVAAVNSGKVASSVIGWWYASSIKKAEDQSGKWAIASFPRMSNVSKSVNASNLGGASWYVLEKVDGKNTAKEFLKSTFASNTELLDQLCKDVSLVSTYKEAANGANVSAADQFFSGQAIYKDFAAWTEKIPAVNYGVATYDVEKKMTEALQNVLKGTAVTDALKKVHTEVEGILSAVG